MSSRAARLMQGLGGGGEHIPADEPEQQEDDGTVSALGEVPNRPLNHYKRGKKVVGAGKKSSVYECRACSYSGISENAKICPECGVQQVDEEEWNNRVTRTRRSLVEGKESWVAGATHMIMAFLEFADPSPYSISEDGTAQEELRGRVTEALLSFSEWQESRHNHQLASNGDNNE